MPHDKSIRLFGRVVARVDSTEISDFTTVHARNLLVYLAMHPDIDHPRDRLVEALWPDRRDGSARNRLSVTLYHMKRTLGDRDYEFADLIVPGRSTIRLDARHVAIDLHQFRECVIRARAAKEIEKRRLYYSRAVEHYTGPLTPDVAAEWAVARQVESSQMFQEAALWLATDLNESGEHDKALNLLSSALDTEPYSERATELLTAWLCEEGNFELALACAKRHRRALASFGQPPSPSMLKRIEDLNAILAERTRSAAFADETVVTILTVQGPSIELFQETVRSRGGTVSQDGKHGLFANPLMAMDAGLQLVRSVPFAKGLVHSTIMGSDDPIPAAASNGMLARESRGLYGSDAFAHLVRERSEDAVRRVAGSGRAWLVE